MPPSLAIDVSERKATLSGQRKEILNHLGFKKYGKEAEERLSTWLKEQASSGRLPNELHGEAGLFLLNSIIILPGPITLKRLVIRICNETHDKVFESLSERLPIELKHKLDDLLLFSESGHHSLFYALKEFPPSASVHSIKHYLHQYRLLNDLGIDVIEGQLADPILWITSID